MKIKYDFADGTSNEVEVTEEMGSVMVELDRLQYNNNQTETRRHRSLERLKDIGIDYSDGTDIGEFIEKYDDISTLHKAMETLLPQQKELLYKVFFEGRTLVSIAAEEGVTKQAINDRLTKIYRKLKKSLS